MDFSAKNPAYCSSMERPKLLQVQWPFAADVEILALIFSNIKNTYLVMGCLLADLIQEPGDMELYFGIWIMTTASTLDWSIQSTEGDQI